MMLRICAVVCLMAVPCLAQESSKTPNPCTGKETCGSCIQAGGQCGWCVQEKDFIEKDKNQCDLVANLISEGCDVDNIKKPGNQYTLDKNDPPRNQEEGQEAVQLTPQEMTVKIRPNTPFKFDVKFRQAENFPVDLYYVMDLSNSMEDDKDKLAQLGNQLAKSMSEITKNFRLGFGSFIDKTTMPYVNTVPEKLQTPCSGCVAPYGFRNQLKLNPDSSIFTREVLRANISGNLDSPEGGLDAIMQAISCHNEIGWRNKSRKLLIFSTDAGFHLAGDGKLGGIVRPNDGQCHLNKHGYYTESLNQDYPSISQLASRIEEESVTVIFAVGASELPVYKKLSEFIKGSVCGKLANDSSNIVTLVRKNYEKISSKLQLEAKNNDGIKVKFRSKCFGNVLKDTDSCDGLKIGGNVTFEVTITVSECSDNAAENRKSFEIHPVGLGEILKVNLDLMCSCDCEGPDQEVQNSPKCNGTGTYECGACTCNPGRYGRFCQCDGKDIATDDFDSACKRTNTSEICEGRGECDCGRCRCNAVSNIRPNWRFSGRYCECNDYGCDYSPDDYQLCSGPDHGKCVCGKCECEEGYTGNICDCPISQEACMAKNGKLCNGVGTCVCGRCQCSSDSYYRGNTCEDCPTCPGFCEQNKVCVLCMAFGKGTITYEDCKANCTHVTLRDSVEENAEKKMCRFRDDDDCMFYFTYEYNSNRVEAQKTKECPRGVNVLSIVLGVIAGIVLVGLAFLLIWKLFTTLHDRREFAKFERERQNARWDTGENPIYKQATSTFKNPMYGGQQ